MQYINYVILVYIHAVSAQCYIFQCIKSTHLWLICWCGLIAVAAHISERPDSFSNMFVYSRVIAFTISVTQWLTSHYREGYSTGRFQHCESWWRYQMEIFSTLLALCVGNSQVIGEFPSQRPVTERFNAFLMCALTNGWANNQDADDLRRNHAHYDIVVMVKTRQENIQL